MSEETKTFKIVNYQISMDVVKYIRKLQNKYLFSYLCIISKTGDDILLPTNDKTKFENYGISAKDYKMLRVLNGNICLSKVEIAKFESTFSKSLGIDYIFSAYFVLYIRAKELFDTSLRFFVLLEKESMCVMAANSKGIRYGAIFDMHEEEVPLPVAPPVIVDPSANKGLDKELSTSSLDLEDLGELEDLDTDLDDLDSIDFDFKDDGKVDEASNAISLDIIQDLGHISSVTLKLQEAIEDFYHNKLYDGEFLSEVVVFASYNMPVQSLMHIKQGLLLDIRSELIDINKEMIKLAELELGEK
ncbi:hypothetical protein BKH43_07775 [Helicobacter sp. 13S00401-1]|uniref:hypothetical protein n=1 Tax=Helicobacter sp. 13S00401-1 TaxID=1905758 RepID=UPI000BA50C4E|nr:hypothetical protein [Helicobacter sp. 13S00401-1]PAF48793.1 hypothetical protein BKH43_07775 [Helicobacter sp. 13S00401-1]